MQGNITSVDDALTSVGQHLGPTDWLLVTQDLIDAFGRNTGDLQWIHVDPQRASEGPFGACVAHGLLTLSLGGGRFFHELIRSTARSGVNYGFDRVRYPAPVLVGSRIRAGAEVLSVQKLDPDGVQMGVRVTVEIEGTVRPACVADMIARYYF